MVGNGPSLLQQVSLLHRLACEHTFACNRFARWGEAPFRPTYYACSAGAVLKGVEPPTPPFQKQRFIVSRRRDELERFPDWTQVYKKEWHPVLLPGAQELLVKGGATQVGIMAQLSAWLGYTQIYLLGTELAEIDPQHPGGHVFDQNGREMPFFYNDGWDHLAGVWREIAAGLGQHGVTISDCTPNGRLAQVLGHVSLEEAMA